jgi:hypothetical protein
MLDLRCQFYLTYPGISQIVANIELPKSEIGKQEDDNIGVAPQLFIILIPP